MAKFDAQERQASGKPIPEEIRRALSQLVATSTVSGEIVDIYEAAGIPKPSLADLGPEFEAQAKQARTTRTWRSRRCGHVIIEESAKATRNNLVRQRAFSEKINELMTALHQPAADLGRGDRRADRDGEGGRRRGQPRRALLAAAVAGRTGVLRRGEHQRVRRRTAGRGRAGADRARAGRGHAARHPRPTGPSATTCEPNCARRSSGCW